MAQEPSCCDMRGFLSFLILFLLSKGEQNGTELAAEIGKRKGNAPTPGTIYPALKGLREEGLIRERKAGRAAYYTLTPAGKRALKEAKLRFCRAFSDLL